MMVRDESCFPGTWCTYILSSYIGGTVLPASSKGSKKRQGEGVGRKGPTKSIFVVNNFALVHTAYPHSICSVT